MDYFLGKHDGQMQCRGILHIVEAGDTLYKIARKYGVPLSRVIYANPYVNVYNLQIGDEICVPVMMSRMPAQNPAADRADWMDHGAVPGNQMGNKQMPGIPENQMGSTMPGSRMGYGVVPANPMGNGAMPGNQPEGMRQEVPESLSQRRIMPTLPNSQPEGAAVTAPGSSLEGVAVAVPGSQLEGAAVAVPGSQLEGAAVTAPGSSLEGVAVAVPGSQLESAVSDGHLEDAVAERPGSQAANVMPGMSGDLSDGTMRCKDLGSPMDSSQADSKMNYEQEANRYEEQKRLGRENGMDERNYFAERQESEKFHQSEDLQQAIEHVADPVRKAKSECMPWENTVVTESMMEDYLRVSR